MPVDNALYTVLMFITDIGDSAVLTLLVISVSLFLLMRGCKREALIFASSLLVTASLIGLSKILVIGCGSELHAMGLRSPSGHSALSIAVLGTLGLLLRGCIQGRARHLQLYLLLLLAFTIAMSRAVLGFHSKEEVVVGMVIGSIVLLACSHFLTRSPTRSFNPYTLIYMTIAVAFIAHGWHLPTEHIIQIIAGHFKTAAACS